MELYQRIVTKIEELRILIKEYHLLNVDQQKATRHMIYTLTGGFGKAIVSIFPQFQTIEEKIEIQKNEDTSNK